MLRSARLSERPASVRMLVPRESAQAPRLPRPRRCALSRSARKKAIIYLGKVASNEDPQNERKALQNQKTISEISRAKAQTIHHRRRNATFRQVP